MRVLHLAPWEPLTSAGRAQRIVENQLGYFQQKGWEVEQVVLGQRPVETSSFSCVIAVHGLDVHCPNMNLRDVLFAFARAARGKTFRSLASKPFDLFFANEVLAAPFAVALPRAVRKVVASHAIHAVRFRALASARSNSLHDAEERWVVRHVEAELYRAFDAAAVSSEADAVRLREAGYASASYVSEHVPVKPLQREGAEAYDLLVVGSNNPHDLEGLQRFYRHVYIPFLRPDRIRLAVAGPVAERFAVADAYVTRLGSTADWPDAKIVVVTTPVGAEALDTTPDAFVTTDMAHDPAGSAEAILSLLRDEPRRFAMRQRAVERMARTHNREAYSAGMDAVIGAVRRAA